VTRPLCLDLFSGDGGAGEGYRRAGFDLIGVDNQWHPYPPGDFAQADAIEVLTAVADTGAWGPIRPHLIHASPPCHDWSDLSSRSGTDGTAELLHRTCDLLKRWGGPYVVENVRGAPLVHSSDLFGMHGVMLCGSTFGLGAQCADGRWRYLQRHRLFESNMPLVGKGGCRHRGEAVGVYGNGGGGRMTRGYKGRTDEAKVAMGIDWMSREDIAQAIPPAYTQFIGGQILDQLEAAA
jgi:DNA (cytosine-5)-methyltransferase 1